MDKIPTRASNDEINTLNLEARIIRLLWDKNIWTIGDLLIYSRQELITLSGIGEVHLAAVETALAEHYLQLKQQLDNVPEREVSINFLGLKRPTRQLLEDNGIWSTQVLLTHSKEELMKFPKLGATKFNEIKRALARFNLRLKGPANFSYYSSLVQALKMIEHPERFTAEEKQNFVNVLRQALYPSVPKL